ncbi:MAG: hypothetical protein KAI53_03345 [Candidatus Aenigmarchaeota archaeon]|nr:hypothetical protein [Candidatus Aenigmarchaeota archaeon]
MIESLVLFISVVASVLIGFSLGIIQGSYNKKATNDGKYASLVNEAESHAKSGFGNGWTAKIGNVILGKDAGKTSKYHSASAANAYIGTEKGLEHVGGVNSYTPAGSSVDRENNSRKYATKESNFHNFNSAAINTEEPLDFGDNDVSISGSKIEGVKEVNARNIVLGQNTMGDTENIKAEEKVHSYGTKLAPGANIKAVEQIYLSSSPGSEIGSLDAKEVNAQPIIEIRGSKENIHIQKIKGGQVRVHNSTVENIDAKPEKYRSDVRVTGNSKIGELDAGNKDIVLGKDASIEHIENSGQIKVYAKTETPNSKVFGSHFPDEGNVYFPENLESNPDGSLSFNKEKKKE